MSYKHETVIVKVDDLDATLDARARNGWDCTHLFAHDKLVIAVFCQWQAADNRESFTVDINMFAATKNKKPVDAPGHGWAPGLAALTHPFDQDNSEDIVDGFAR
jgi:hypothetical protein